MKVSDLVSDGKRTTYAQGLEIGTDLASMQTSMDSIQFTLKQLESEALESPDASESTATLLTQVASTLAGRSSTTANYKVTALNENAEIDAADSVDNPSILSTEVLLSTLGFNPAFSITARGKNNDVEDDGVININVELYDLDEGEWVNGSEGVVTIDTTSTAAASHLSTVYSFTDLFGGTLGSNITKLRLMQVTTSGTAGLAEVTALIISQLH